MDVFVEVLREGADRELAIRLEGLLIGGGDGDDVLVGYQVRPVSQGLQLILSLALESGLHFLGDHLAAEDAGEAVAHRALELALEPLQDSHGTTSPFLSVS